MAFQSPYSPIATPTSFKTNPASGRNAHIFKPPRSPASATTTPSFATATDYFSAGSRKRTRTDSSANQGLWAATTPGWTQCPTPTDGSYTSAGANSGYGQNSVLVNERYRLAGGLDTPGLQATADMEHMQLGSSKDGRRWRGSASGHVPSASTPLSGPLSRERNGVSRMPSSPNGEASSTWTGLAFSLVGKVFSFGTSVVKGFYAGGGKGYDLSHSPLSTMWASQPACATPLPGSWQEDQTDFFGDFEQDNPQSATRPPNKRRQTDRDSWVMVGARDTPDMSPRRKLSSSSIPRPSNLATRPSASRASSRRHLAPLPRRASSYIATAGSPAVQPLLPMSPERRASFAPMRSNSRPSSSGNNPGNAYISPEAERYVKRREKQDRRQDAAMSDMSRKLADLIRQGQEALGTKFEVEGGSEGGVREEDEGFVDEEW